MTPNPFFDVARFMHAAGQDTNKFNPRQVGLYVGLQLEEMAEKLDAIFGKGNSSAAVDMQVTGDAFKRGAWDHLIEKMTREQKIDCVDADFDLAWVSIAATISLGVQPGQAWQVGAQSNLKKIDPVTGSVIKDPSTGKVQKPEGWRAPDFGVCVTANL